MTEEMSFLITPSMPRVRSLAQRFLTKENSAYDQGAIASAALPWWRHFHDTMAEMGVSYQYGQSYQHETSRGFIRDEVSEADPALQNAGGQPRPPRDNHTAIDRTTPSGVVV